MRRSPSLPAVILPALALVFALGGRGAHDAAASVTPESKIDTVLAVASGDIVQFVLNDSRLVLEGIEGAGLEIDDGSRRGIEVGRNGGRIVVRVRGRNRGGERFVRVGVPRGVAVEVSGERVEVEASGVRGDLRVNVLEGDLVVSDVLGDVEVRTVDGDIDIVDVEGAVQAATVDGTVRLAGIRGSASAQSMDGDLVLDDVDGDEVSASTVDGDVSYDGPLSRGSRVELVTHDGDVVVSIPADVSADFELATFDGEFLPQFPIRVGRIESGQPLRFRLGSGDARLGVQVFDGDIQLRHRPGR